MVEKKMDSYFTISPSSGELVREFSFDSQEVISEKLEQSKKGFSYLSKISFGKRAEILNLLAQKIDSQLQELAKLITLEMGKPIKQAKAEVAKCAEMARYHAKNGEAMLEGERVEFGSTLYEFHYESLGPILFISTWNNPLLQATLAVVPQLVAGNSTIIKPAPNTPQCVLAIERLFEEMNLPERVYAPVFSSIPQTEKLIKNPAVSGLTFIGGTKAGRRVSILAAENFKPSVIDAGGSDPFLVLADADISKAAAAAAASRYSNAGQSCVAAKRIIVQESVHQEFLSKLIEESQKLTVGDPFDENTDLGPLALEQSLESVKLQLEKSVAEGAVVELGGDQPDLPGFYFNPTILSGASSKMVCAREEVFGPISVLFKAASTEEMIEIANDTPFGLGASIWGKSAADYAPAIKTGNVAINSKIATNFPLPFGGIKDSGRGVYFGKEGVRTFMNQKIFSFEHQ